MILYEECPAIDSEKATFIHIYPTLNRHPLYIFVFNYIAQYRKSSASQTE